MISHEKKVVMISSLRWIVSIAFFFMAIIKIKMILNHGLEPYRIFSETVGWPETFKHYGAIAVLLEVSTASMLWIKALYRFGLGLMLLLTLAGSGISIYSLIFKISADCECGLFGDNEYSLLLQKLLIIIALIVLYRNKNELFIQAGEKA